MPDEAGAMASACAASPAIPRDGGGPVFSEPWEATAFAIVARLHEAGHLDWGEWTSELGAQVAGSAHARAGHTDDYYACWVGALETLLLRKGILSADALRHSVRRTHRTWPHPDHSARREPVARSLPLAGPDTGGTPPGPGIR